jgi:Activator of Hsp90 ATPase homolog 1-like protein
MTNTAIVVSIEVAADPQVAFDVFTTGVDAWWLRGPAHRFRAPWDGKLLFEPGPAGRLIEEYADGTTFVIGRVVQWEPGRRLLLSWRLPNFKDTETTEVDVHFEPIDGGTRVSVEHRGWDALRAGHPARHGTSGRDFQYMKADLWAQNLTSLRRYFELRACAQPPEASGPHAR